MASTPGTHTVFSSVKQKQTLTPNWSTHHTLPDMPVMVDTIPDFTVPVFMETCTMLLATPTQLPTPLVSTLLM